MLAVENGNLDLAFFGVLVKGDGHDIARFYSLVPPCVGIHNDVLPAPVPNRAAPSVAIDRRFDRPGLPHTSRVSNGSVNDVLASLRDSSPFSFASNSFRISHPDQFEQ